MSTDKDDLSGEHARDSERGFGDNYARDGGWSGGGRHDDYVRDQPADKRGDEDEIGIGKASE